jgi:diadenosine tetraphosphatase ApaH/serine/threonine PP2A family protein phosphatase
MASPVKRSFHISSKLLYYSCMRYAIIADIHSNLEAFTAVLGDIERKGGVDEIWCLGDIVGYGPDPHQCIESLRRCKHICVAGNHDWAAIGKVDTSYFNPMAATACQWTAKQLSPEDIEYLESLPLTIEKNGFTLVHGSPMEPIWEYVISTSIAAKNFAYFRSPFCLVGHSHVPAVYKEMKGLCRAVPFSPSIGMVLGEERMIINPGGVGQPRDGDPRASYAIYDSDSRVLRLYRLPYDIGATQDKMMQAGLPIHLITRLKEGR